MRFETYFPLGSGIFFVNRLGIPSARDVGRRLNVGRRRAGIPRRRAFRDGGHSATAGIPRLRAFRDGGHSATAGFRDDALQREGRGGCGVSRDGVATTVPAVHWLVTQPGR